MAYPKLFDMTHRSLGKILVTSTVFRNISTCTVNCNKYAAREVRFMKKIMGNKKTGNKPWYKFQDATPVSSFPKTIASIGSQKKRRIAMLNNVFMRYISEMLATGELSSVIVGRGIQISRVKITSDFNRINVFWSAGESENDAEIEEILEKYSWKLRHELSQLRIIGVVPPIYFIKDKEYSKVVEVNRLLATADFGEDYVPVDVGYHFKSEFAQTLPLSQMNQMQQLEEDESEEISEPPLPPMRTDVLGLHHAYIMAKIKMGMKKAKALHRQNRITSDIESEPEQAEIDLPVNVNVKKEEFTKFLMKKQIERKKMFQGKKNYTPEMEIYETEVLENSSIAAEFMDNTDKDMDYIEEIEIK